jgi:hypothetical protein
MDVVALHMAVMTMRSTTPSMSHTLLGLSNHLGCCTRCVATGREPQCHTQVVQQHMTNAGGFEAMPHVLVLVACTGDSWVATVGVAVSGCATAPSRCLAASTACVIQTGNSATDLEGYDMQLVWPAAAGRWL